jgi:hypothetical protein
MVKYFGYIMSDSWLHQKALDIGYPPAKTPEDLDDNISLASINVMAATGVISYARVRRVKTPKGKYFWCIALACDDPFAVGERSLSTHPPPEAKYKALKEALGKDGPPHWYRAIWNEMSVSFPDRQWTQLMFISCRKSTSLLASPNVSPHTVEVIES